MASRAGTSDMLRDSLRYFRPYRWRIAGATGLSIIAAQAEAVLLVLLAPTALAISAGRDSYAGKLGPFEIDVPVTTLLWIGLAATLTAAVFTITATVVRARFLSHWAQVQRNAFVDEYMRASYPAQLSLRSGHFEVQFSTFVARGQTALLSFMGLLRAVFAVAIYVGTSMVVDLRGTMLLIATGLTAFLLLRPLNQRLRRISKEMSTVGISYAANVAEITRSVRDIRVFGARDTFGRRLKRLSDKGATLERHQMTTSGLTSPAYQYLGLLLVIGVLALAALVPSIGVTSLAATALLLLRSISYGQLVQTSYQSIIESVPFFDEVTRTREMLRERPDTDGDKRVDAIGALELEGVHYSYGGTNEALTGVHLTMNVGETIGIVGPSGSGKSTLAQIILRLRQPDRGTMLVGGVPAEQISLDSWCKLVSFVPQQCALLHESVTENIRYFDDELTDVDVRRAAVSAGLAEVIEGLDDGYDTELGASVRELSGGQIQRIGIARAFARHRDVVVLDEPTSALDIDAEIAVQDALQKLKGSCLLVIIAHRVSTLADCDRIVVLEGGQVTADGSPTEVARSNPFFERAITTGVLDVESPNGSELTIGDSKDPGSRANVGDAGTLGTDRPAPVTRR